MECFPSIISRQPWEAHVTLSSLYRWDTGFLKSPVLSGQCADLPQGSAGNARHGSAEVPLVNRPGTEFWFMVPPSLGLFLLLPTPTFNPRLVSLTKGHREGHLCGSVGYASSSWFWLRS